MCVQNQERWVTPGQHHSLFMNAPGLIAEGGCTTGREAKAGGDKQEGQVIADLWGKDGKRMVFLTWHHKVQQLRRNTFQKLFLLKFWQHIPWLYQNIKHDFKVVVF